MSRRIPILLLTILVVGVASGQGDSLLRDVSADSLRKGMRFTALVTNRGSESATFWTELSIEDSTGSVLHTDSLQVVDLAAGSPAELTFPDIGIRRPGTYTARCSVALAGDENPENDTASLRFVVPYIDVCTAGIYWPSDTVVEGMVSRPAYEVTNYGAETVDLWAWFSLGYNYAESLFVEGLVGGTNMTMEFPTWRAFPSGWIPMACSLLVVAPESLVCSPYQGSLYVRPSGAIVGGEPGEERQGEPVSPCRGVVRLPGRQSAVLLNITGRRVISLYDYAVNSS
jgi:hypothetical protein